MTRNIINFINLWKRVFPGVFLFIKITWNTMTKKITGILYHAWICCKEENIWLVM